jgi:hypothetical protein
MRISTLIDYLDSLGMGLEIIACPRTPVRGTAVADINGQRLLPQITANQA